MRGANMQMKMFVISLMLFFMGTIAVDVEGVACCIGTVYTCCYESGLPPMAMTPMAMSPMPAPGPIIGEKKKVLGRKAYSIIPSIIHH